MTTELSPTQAAEIASGTCLTRLSSDLAVAGDALPSIRNGFDLHDGTRLVGGFSFVSTMARCAVGLVSR